MAAKLQHSLNVEVPADISWEYDYASTDGSKLASFHLIGEISALKQLLEEALRALDGA